MRWLLLAILSLGQHPESDTQGGVTGQRITSRIAMHNRMYANATSSTSELQVKLAVHQGRTSPLMLLDFDTRLCAGRKAWEQSHGNSRIGRAQDKHDSRSFKLAFMSARRTRGRKDPLYLLLAAMIVSPTTTIICHVQSACFDYVLNIWTLTTMTDSL